MLNPATQSKVQSNLYHLAENLTYAEGLYLSRNFQSRNRTQTALLHYFIQICVDRAKNTSNIHESKRALTFLVQAYEPFIFHTTKSILLEMHFSDEYVDLKQYVYEAFILLTYKYNESYSSFSYYIKKYLKMYTKEYIKKFMHSSKNISLDTVMLDIVLSSRSFSYHDSTFDMCMGNILKDMYVKFIIQRSQSLSRTSTIKEVCFRYFLGSESCIAIAQDLGITYTSVYQIITKIKYELAEYLTKSTYCSFTILSEKGFKLYEKA